MQILATPEDVAAFRKPGKTLALVPTMGNLHEGHLSLVKLARQYADEVVVSIFVNRLQFGPNEDFDRYPRTFERDSALLAANGCHAVFHPSETVLYPVPQSYLVEPPELLANTLCGAFRPGHFQGVCTVVSKLFNVIRPDAAVFGLKDFQQYLILREMTKQMNHPIQIIGGDIVRETDGLAMSSRNQYLNPTERQEATRLYQLLQNAREALKQGGVWADIQQATMQALEEHGWKNQYFEWRSEVDLSPCTDLQTPSRLLVAAFNGQTRLIDNIAL
ncbi:pantoate--beta-alanine ligase [Leeia sp. TBRC 13508]|uniref:Pantothenate synthetase n=1 Tax=Leeia speluncae TaxID=2884804 RepID=A0ABS8D7H2_9NEIS|nr:pantoate--beta-alanine ligase [Leeia speluncae]MCB6184133.1 pantoate--beta-alanine ligase [Leeia speluncae]